MIKIVSYTKEGKFEKKDKKKDKKSTKENGFFFFFLEKIQE